MVLHLKVAANRLLYLSYVKPGPNGYGCVVGDTVTLPSTALVQPIV